MILAAFALFLDLGSLVDLAVTSVAAWWPPAAAAVVDGLLLWAFLACCPARRMPVRMPIRRVSGCPADGIRSTSVICADVVRMASARPSGRPSGPHPAGGNRCA